MFADEELDALARTLPLDIRRAAVAPAAGFEGVAGPVTELLKPEMVTATTDSYLCGPPGMVQTAQKMLDQIGQDKKRIFAEKFLPAA
jgi:ferredoxin-NADP reductase